MLKKTGQFKKRIRGVLNIKIVRGEFTRDTDWCGKMDPYTVMTIDQKVYKTQVKDEAGKTPVWNCKFDFYVKDLFHQIIRFKVRDEDPGPTDDDVGDTTVKLSTIVGRDSNEHEFWLAISYQGKNAGKLLVKT